MIELGKLDTLSSPNTVAGVPVAALTIVTRVPLTGAPLALSNTSPNGSISTPTDTAPTDVPSLTSSSSTRKLSPGCTDSTQSPGVADGCCAGGIAAGSARVLITPIKRPLLADVSVNMMRSRSLFAVIIVTSNCSTTVESRFLAGASTCTTSGSPARMELAGIKLAGLVESPEKAPPRAIGVAPLLPIHIVLGKLVEVAPGAPEK